MSESKQRPPSAGRRPRRFPERETIMPFSWVPLVSVAVLAFLALPLLHRVKRAQPPQVVIYTSQDQVHAEPILQAFTRRTGIEVKPVYDSESVKTVGLANRLLAEKGNPQCDVFWNNEELRTRQLAARELFQTWSPILEVRRLRQLVVNTNLMTPAQAPRSLGDLTNAVWSGKIALAYPLFGTTATHFLALRQAWGEQRWLDWCRALQANRPLVVDGNSLVVRLVGQGEAWMGLTDSDDIRIGKREGLPVEAVSLGTDTLAIPNTVAVVRGAPHPQHAAQLAEYLQSDRVKDELVLAGAMEPLWHGFQAGLNVDWDRLLLQLDAGTDQLKTVFLR